MDRSRTLCSGLDVVSGKWDPTGARGSPEPALEMLRLPPSAWGCQSVPQRIPPPSHWVRTERVVHLLRPPSISCKRRPFTLRVGLEEKGGTVVLAAPTPRGLWPACSFCV